MKDTQDLQETAVQKVKNENHNPSSMSTSGAVILRLPTCSAGALQQLIMPKQTRPSGFSVIVPVLDITTVPA